MKHLSFAFPMGAWMLSCLLCSGMASGQAAQTQEELREKALSAFNQKDWAVAHQRLSELLSVNGTDAELQMRYAVTLLHDGQMRPEGIQRLVSLWEDLEGSPSPELAFWWGKAWMLQGDGLEAQKWLKVALEGAPKKAIWKDELKVAVAQSERLPQGFDLRQDLVKVDDFELPQTSFHRYISWGRDATRLMATPEELQSKQDSKAGLYAPIAFSRLDGVLYHHSISGKGETGSDVFVAELSEGGFVNHQRLPAPVNSDFDEKNPVWDASSQTLFFSSNRPGTMGGFDLFQTHWDGTSWSNPLPLSPVLNSVYDELAIYPASDVHSGWLVTNREGAFGAFEVWEFEMDGEARRPVLLTTQWEVDGEVVPGTLEVYDAESSQALASVEVNEERGQWNLAVASGQTLRYLFTGADGLQVEGTYALPHSDVAGVLSQQMTMTHSGEATTLKADPLAKAVEERSGLTWGWNLATAEAAKPEWRLWEEENDSLAFEPLASPIERRVVQFKSYPWWTETQNEERAIAASLLSAYMPNDILAPVSPESYGSALDWRKARAAQAIEIEESAVEALLSLAAAEVLGNEMAWEDAMRVAVDRSAKAWPTGTLDLEVVVRKAQRRWGAKGDLYDLDLLPEVRDKRGLLGDGAWVQEPWASGKVTALGTLYQSLRLEHEDMDLVWAISQQRGTDDAFWKPWARPGAWDLGKVEAELQILVELTTPLLSDATAPGNDVDIVGDRDLRSLELSLEEFLASCRDRLTVLDAMEWPASLDPEGPSQILGRWRALAIQCSSALQRLRESSETSQLEPQAGGADEVPGEVASAEGLDHGRAGAAVIDKALNDAETVDEWVQSHWADFWEEQTRKMDPTLPWEAEWKEWLEFHSGQTSDLSELAQRALAGPADPLAMTANAANGAEGSMDKPLPSPIWLNEVQKGLEKEWQGVQTPSVNAMEILRASWLLSRWSRDPNNSEKSPDEAVAMQEDWPPSIVPMMDRARVEWAQSMTREAQAQRPDSVSTLNAFREAAVGESAPEEGAALDEAVTPTPKTPADVVVSSSVDPMKQEAQRGDMGLQLGWFRRAPELQQLPLGTFLSAEDGKSGLKRWVLVFPQEEGTRGQALSGLLSWTLAQGIQDAYQVELGDLGWTRDRPSPDDAPTATAEADAAALSASDASSAATALSSAQGQDVAPEWLHGAPVELGDLSGTWFAVQVGAFRGWPESDWVDMAGEQLVFEKFEDGLARWYAGVRASRAKATGRLVELKLLAPFQDAFLVQLSGGERVVLGPDELVVEEEAQSNSKGDAPTQTTEIGQEEMLNSHAVTSPETVLTEAVALPQESPVKRKKTTPSTWHIDIARYFGRVPSSEVAVLLLRSRDWGVRSVEVMGQTTYFSRSFVDLAEAKAILEETFKEGFVEAVLVEDP